MVDKPCNNECDDVKDRNCGNNEERIDCNVSLQSLERPGWFGKGYSKNKKSLRKRRRVR